MQTEREQKRQQKVQVMDHKKRGVDIEINVSCFCTNFAPTTDLVSEHLRVFVIVHLWKILFMAFLTALFSLPYKQKPI